MANYHKYTILIVDDDETLRNALVYDYKKRGFTVFSAENGTKALELVLTERIDLVISDIRMPNGDGIELLRKIRERDPRIPVVMFLTGFAEATEMECLRNGATKVFTKPFDRKVLAEAVIAALETAAAA